MNPVRFTVCVLSLVLSTLATASGQTIFTVAGSATGGYSGDGGPATLAMVRNLQGISVDAAGNYYFADYGASVIRKVDIHGIITTVAGNGTASYGGDTGPATAAEINYPTDVAVDNAGNLYIADSWNNAIRKVNTSGIINTIAGIGGSGFSGDGGAATAAQLNNPTGVAVDRSGNLYIADNRNNRIRMITAAGIISTVAGSDSFGYSGDGRAATAAGLSGPNNVSVDTFGNLYIADGNNNRIRKVNTSGIISTIAGTGILGFSGDGGPATAAKIYSPFEMALDGGNIYFADYDNDRIRKIDTGGIITTIAGHGSSLFGGDGGPATAAGMHPRGVAIHNGALYVTDFTNFRVRKICDFPVAGNIYGADSICAGTTTTYTDPSTGGVWTTTNSSIATINNTTGVTGGVAAGIDTIIYTVTNYCSTIATAAFIIVNPQPDAGMIIGRDTICPFLPVSLSVTGIDGSWSSTNTTVATVSATGAVTGIPGGGLDTIRYIVTNSCGSDTASHPMKIYIDCESGIAPVSATTNELSISPNPNTGAFSLLLSSPFTEGGVATITNILGKKVQQVNFVTNNAVSVALHLPAGLYLIAAETPHGRYVSRVSVEE